MLRFVQVIAAVLGAWAAIFVGAKNGYIIGACGFFAAMLTTYVYQRVSCWWLTGSLWLIPKGHG